MTATTQLAVGAVVRYHGSITSEHYATFYIQAIDGPRLRLVDREYPAAGILRNVHPGHVTPTGETVDLCACGHEVAHCLDMPGMYRPTTCGATPCPCISHFSKESA